MSINHDVMINAIQTELDKRGRTQRLLTKDVARRLWNMLKARGYQRNNHAGLKSNNTSVTFTQAQCNRIKVSFCVVN